MMLVEQKSIRNDGHRSDGGGTSIRYDVVRLYATSRWDRVRLITITGDFDRIFTVGITGNVTTAKCAGADLVQVGRIIEVGGCPPASLFKRGGGLSPSLLGIPPFAEMAYHVSDAAELGFNLADKSALRGFVLG